PSRTTPAPPWMASTGVVATDADPDACGVGETADVDDSAGATGARSSSAARMARDRDAGGMRPSYRRPGPRAPSSNGAAVAPPPWPVPGAHARHLGRVVVADPERLADADHPLGIVEIHRHDRHVGRARDLQEAALPVLHAPT